MTFFSQSISQGNTNTFQLSELYIQETDFFSLKEKNKNNKNTILFEILEIESSFRYSFLKT